VGDLLGIGGLPLVTERLPMTLSVIPSLRYSAFGSAPTFSNGRTAMESMAGAARPRKEK
jgi:hypothetical protein